MSVYDYTPGTLVHARNRDWVVQPSQRENLLRLRPLGGSEQDCVVLDPQLEIKQPEPSFFSFPRAEESGSYEAASLYRDALMLKLKNGAGPFRSFGKIAVEPRAYQLVPLLMALRQETIRLLIADDVGIGKTIEAGLIVRELYERFEIRRFAVLVPPHLVDQWVQELQNRFHFRPVALTTSSVSRLEKELPAGQTIFSYYDAVVISLDYIKSERHREHFISSAPECIVVDEAHTCTIRGGGKQLRFELLQRLSQDLDRHMILLTATPHSGDDIAFGNMISLLDVRFAELQAKIGDTQDPLRQQLSKHFVQRRRKDIEEWQDADIFPRRYTTEITYRLTGKWGDFFDQVRSYCYRLADAKEGNKHMIWYATLALLRCVSSSPAAAEKTLSSRFEGTMEDYELLIKDEDVMDGSSDDLATDDQEPTMSPLMQNELKKLISYAGELKNSSGDPKLSSLIRHLTELLDEGFRPVVFCRYVATAHYVADRVKNVFKDHDIDVITGELPPEDREERVFLLSESSHPLLIATDCLSEGINLQEGFNAVVHYDLAWNPTRHEQREGRVDRFGQKAKEVRCTLLYGEDNPIDGFMLQTILRKADKIRKELGVLVPLPEDDGKVKEALLKAAFIKERTTDHTGQQWFDFSSIEEHQETVETQWQDAMEKAKANRTIFAQRRLKPEDVLPEWNKQQEVLGTSEMTKDFVISSLKRLNSPLQEIKRKGYRFSPKNLPSILGERFQAEGFSKDMLVDFTYPTPAGVTYLHRSHPVVTLISEIISEDALEGNHQYVARSAAAASDQIAQVHTLFLLRIRHQIGIRKQNRKNYGMAEEMIIAGCKGRSNIEWIDDNAAAKLLRVSPSSNLDRAVQIQEIEKAIELFKQQSDHISSQCRVHAEQLLQDHRRVREAAQDRGAYTVDPCLPPDLMGVFVLLPDIL